MKKNYLFILLLLANIYLFSQEDDLVLHLKFKKTFEVEGRQGITADSNFYYVSGSKSLYKYDKHGKLILKNENPFQGFSVEVNHIGDIDVNNGEIFAGCEWFEDGRGKNIQIAVYDVETLKLIRTINWSEKSGQVEVSGITIDKKNNLIWMTDWVNGSYIYKYDLLSGDYLGKVHLKPVPQYQQGILSYKNNLFLTADDGDAEENENDNLYSIIPTEKTNVKVKLQKEFNEFKRTGEIEGLTIDPASNELLVLMNRGRRIIFGMPKGFYPGYDKE
ncbi:MAG: hypothetical protein ABI550_07355, partial [Ignavibacteriaceae bacterium]